MYLYSGVRAGLLVRWGGEGSSSESSMAAAAAPGCDCSDTCQMRRAQHKDEFKTRPSPYSLSVQFNSAVVFISHAVDLFLAIPLPFFLLCHRFISKNPNYRRPALL